FLATHVLADLDLHFAVAERADRGLAERNIELLADRAGQMPVRIARKDQDAGVVHIGFHTSPREGWIFRPRHAARADTRHDIVREAGELRRLAGAAGFEPANAGIKTPCLTTWRRPNAECRKVRRGPFTRRIVRLAPSGPALLFARAPGARSQLVESGALPDSSPTNPALA